jgi:hypothetical protein
MPRSAHTAQQEEYVLGSVPLWYTTGIEIVDNDRPIMCPVEPTNSVASTRHAIEVCTFVRAVGPFTSLADALHKGISEIGGVGERLEEDRVGVGHNWVVYVELRCPLDVHALEFVG